MDIPHTRCFAHSQQQDPFSEWRGVHSTPAQPKQPARRLMHICTSKHRWHPAWVWLLGKTIPTSRVNDVCSGALPSCHACHFLRASFSIWGMQRWPDSRPTWMRLTGRGSLPLEHRRLYIHTHSTVSLFSRSVTRCGYLQASPDPHPCPCLLLLGTGARCPSLSTCIC